MSKIKNWLASTRARYIILLCGTLLVLPSIGPRLVFDDYLHAALLSPSAPSLGIPHAPLDLFVFARPGTTNDLLIDRGMLLPWWTDRNLLIAFCRPLSSLTHVIDTWLWPDSPRAMHVHNVAWYVLLLAVVAKVYRRFIEPPWMAGAAFLLYAIDDTHGATVSWIANRNALLATLLGLLAFAFHDRWRRDGLTSRAWWATGTFALGLLAGEAASSALAFVVAYAMFFDTADRRSRALSVLPYIAVVVLWRATYQWLGYGAFGSEAYIDPGREPVAWFGRLPSVLAVLVQGQIGFFGADLWNFRDRPLLVVLALGNLALLLVLFFPLLRSDRMTRFWATGALGALLPVASSIPSDRLLLFSNVAAMPLFVQLFGRFAERMAPFPTKGALRFAMAVPLALIFARRVALAPFMVPLRASSMDAIGALADRAADAVPKTPDVAAKTIVVVNPPSHALASYVALTRANRGEPVPLAVRWLAEGSSEVALTRVSERTVKLRPTGGLFASWTDFLYRSPRNPLRMGDVIHLRDMSVKISAESPDGQLTEAEIEFTEPLESPRYVWQQWEGDRCVPFTPPPVGVTVVLPAIDMAKLVVDQVMKSPFERGGA